MKSFLTLSCAVATAATAAMVIAHNEAHFCSNYVPSVKWDPNNVQSISGNTTSGVNDQTRNSGVVVCGDQWFGINGVHMVNIDLSVAYNNSIVQGSVLTGEVTRVFTFNPSTAFNYDIDIRALSWGPDGCASSMLYLANGQNLIFQMDLNSGSLLKHWDLNIQTREGRGIEALTYDPTSDLFWVGTNQGENMLVAVQLESTASSSLDQCIRCNFKYSSWLEVPLPVTGLFFLPSRDGEPQGSGNSLFVLYGTNEDKKIYVYALQGRHDKNEPPLCLTCKITIPSSGGLASSNGLFIDPQTNVAYVADSQGTIYSTDWVNPCNAWYRGTAAGDSNSATEDEENHEDESANDTHEDGNDKESIATTKGRRRRKKREEEERKKDEWMYVPAN